MLFSMASAFMDVKQKVNEMKCSCQESTDNKEEEEEEEEEEEVLLYLL